VEISEIQLVLIRIPQLGNRAVNLRKATVNYISVCNLTNTAYFAYCAFKLILILGLAVNIDVKEMIAAL